MNKIVMLCVLLALCVVSAEAIELTPMQSRTCQVAATGWVPLLVGKANTIDLNYRTSQSMQSVMTPWLRVQAGSSDSLGIVFTDSVYAWIVSKMSDWSYGTVYVPDDHAAPENCAINGSNIECDESPGKTPYLLKWDGTESFIDTGVSPTNSGGKDIFDISGQSVGNYSILYSTDAFCSVFVTIQ